MTEIPIPEWVDSQSKPADGLDLLGLRLPVQIISTSLINGVTTISPRIRYLSIRAWVIKMFGESGLPNKYSVIADFASRVECAIALGILIHNKDTINIPGVTNALTLIEDDVDPIPVQQLVKQTAFRIYAGPSYDLLLSYVGDDGIPGITKERGMPLAIEFDALINETEFYKLLKEEPLLQSIPRNVLQELGSVIDVENIQTHEKEAILKALIPEALFDNRRQVETNRIMVYTLLLELAKRHQRIPKEEDLFEVALNPTPELNDLIVPLLDGYLLYRVRDVLAVVQEAILGEMCAELRGYEGAIPSNELIDAFLGEHINLALQGVGLLGLDESFENIRFLDLASRVETKLLNKVDKQGLVRWKGDLNENILIERVLKNQREAAGLLPVVWLLCRHRIESEEEESFSSVALLSHQGNFRMGFQQIIRPMLKQWEEEDPTLADVISWQIRRVVDQHLRIAWSRMFVDVKKDVALLISDGDLWKSREHDYTGGHTASRLPQTIRWLRQLHLIDKNGLTDVGKKELIRGYRVLSQLESEEVNG